MCPARHRHAPDQNDNDREYDLLFENPQALLLEYQEMFRIVIKQAIGGGMVKIREYDEIFQIVNMEMLKRIPSIRRNYDGRALLRTYVTQMALNVCRRHSKELSVYESQNTPLAKDLANSESVTDALMIEEAVSLFRSSLSLFGRHRAKVLLFLKLYYRISLTFDDVRSVYPRAPEEIINEFVARFQDFESERGRDVMVAAAPFLNVLGRKVRIPESYRHWAKTRVDELCDMLNGNPPVSSFTAENLKVLVEDYFCPFLPGSGYK